MGKFFAIGLASLLGVTTIITFADDQPKQTKKATPASVGMKVKLDFAKAILGGLATGDYKAIEKNGKAMQGLNAIEYFARGKTPEYQAQLESFQLAVNELVRNAKAENLDGATLAYTQLTIRCVNCHKQLRK